MNQDSSTRLLLDQAALFFGLGRIQTIEKLELGWANRNFRLNSTKGSFVVKDLLIHSRDEIELELLYLRHLKRHGYPVVDYLSSDNGEQIYASEGHLVMAQTLIAGQHPQSTPAVCHTVGRALGRLHLIPSGDLLRKKHWMEAGYLPSLFEALKEETWPRLEQARQAFDALRPLSIDDLPHTIIHADMGPNNLLFSKDRLVAILDWEEVGLGAALLDLAVSVYELAQHGGRVQTENFVALIEGYETLRKLQPIERANLTRAVRYVALTNSVWILHHYGYLYPDPQKAEAADYFWRLNLDSLELPSF